MDKKSKKKVKRYPWSRIKHEQIYLRSRGHSIDIHVYPVCQRLWDADIQTFFSCQGGPSTFKSGYIGHRERIKTEQAMVVILKKDKKKALKILKKLNPKVGKWDNRHNLDHIGIDFNPSQEAQKVHVSVTAK